MTILGVKSEISGFSSFPAHDEHLDNFLEILSLILANFLVSAESQLNLFLFLLVLLLLLFILLLFFVISLSLIQFSSNFVSYLTIKTLSDGKGFGDGG